MDSDLNMSMAVDRLKQASKQRYLMLRDQTADIWQNAGTYWARYRPTTWLGWACFCGLMLLAASAVSTALNILGAVGLGIAWVGLVVYFFTVATSSVAALFCGPALMVFSGTCAVIGTCILSGVVGVYGMMMLAGRARGYATPYLEAMQQRAKQQQLPPTAQMRHAPQGSPARLSSSSQHTRNVDTASNATTGSAQLLGEISPGKPQVAELVSPSGGAPAHNYSTDIPAASKQPTSSSTSTTTSSSKGHIKTGGGSGNNSTQRTGGLSSGSGGNSAGMHRASAAVSSTA